MITKKNKEFMMTYGKINVEDYIDDNPRLIANRPDLQSHHIDRILDTNHSESIHKIALNRKLSDDQFDKILSKHKAFMMSLSENPNLSKNQIDKAINSTPKFFIGRHPNLEPHHIDKLLSDPSVGVRKHLATRTDLKPHHIDKLMNDENSEVADTIARHPEYQEYIKGKK